MKKIFIIILIILVAGIVALYAINEFQFREITYVGDYASEQSQSGFAVKRLYSSDIDYDKYNEMLEKLISIEFTEEEILRAALESGTPEFYPAFYTAVQSVKDENGEDNVTLQTVTLQELADNQPRTNFRLANLRLEVVTNDVTIENVSAKSYDEMNNETEENALINDAGTGMTVELDSNGSTELTLSSASGTVVLQYVFDVEYVSLSPKIALSDCFLRIDAVIGQDENGRLTLDYNVNPASTVDEYIEQE